MAITIPPWSYTAIDIFDQCPKKYYHKFILKEKEPQTPEMLEGIKVHNALEKRVAANIPLPIEYKKYDPMCQSIINAAARDGGTIRTELKVGLNRELKATDFFAKDIYGRGALDVAILAPASNPNFVFVGDWKTGKTREKDLQVRIFALFAFITFPTAQRVDACNLWLPTLKVGQRYRYFREDMPKIWSEVFMKLAGMENAAVAGIFPPRPTPLCGWCPVLTCEHNPKKEK